MLHELPQRTFIGLPVRVDPGLLWLLQHGTTLQASYRHALTCPGRVSLNSRSCSQGGIGAINFPLLSDITKQFSRDYGVLIEEGPDAGHALRCAAVTASRGLRRTLNPCHNSNPSPQSLATLIWTSMLRTHIPAP